MGKLVYMKKIEEGFDYSCGTFTGTFDREVNTYYATSTPSGSNTRRTGFTVYKQCILVMMHPEPGTINFLFLSTENGVQVDFLFQFCH